jgi:hypothetical protein
MAQVKCLVVGAMFGLVPGAGYSNAHDSTSSSSSVAPEDGQFSTREKSVWGFARMADDGYLEIIPNKAYAHNSPVLRCAPGSQDFKFYQSALGGIEKGSVKRIPESSGKALMEDDGTIFVIYRPAVVNNMAVGAPVTMTYAPGDPRYDGAAKLYRLSKPGDGYLIPANQEN